MKKEIETYLSKMPLERRNRIETIRKAFMQAESGVQETMKYKMPTFEKQQNWVSIANQKNYISVYFCSEELIRNIKQKHPRINTGKGCVRIRDNQEVPVTDLVLSSSRSPEKG